ncbi:hypothetical protein [Pedobacter sp. UYP1]|uniref:hypothetical protein n=1 Tax=Pedobacter sp. UYP1 TaxID=1756396 RepID=UPI003394FF6B
MMLVEFKTKLISVQQRKLSGGITCHDLRIQNNGSRVLTISGDVTITIKVLDLTTKGASRMHSLINSTQHIISTKLTGTSSPRYGAYLHNFDPKSKKFGTDSELYTIYYNINYIVKLEHIIMLSQLSGNDFVLAVVDTIGFKSDKYGTSGLTWGKKGPSTVAYNDWCQYPYIAAHEFFHSLGLPDLFDKNDTNSLMYNMNGRHMTNVSSDERSKMNNYLIRDIEDMYKGNYTNPSLNTVNNLRTFLNDPTNGFKYNKAKFR